jgi:hypothetical protein
MFSWYIIIIIIIIIKSFSNSDAVFKLFMLIKAEKNLIFMKFFSFNDVSNQEDATNSAYWCF